MSSEFVIAMKEATRLHADAMKQAGNTAAKADQLGPPHLHAWNSILKTLKAKSSSMTEPERQMLDGYIREVTPGGWKGLQTSSELNKHVERQMLPGQAAMGALSLTR